MNYRWEFLRRNIYFQSDVKELHRLAETRHARIQNLLVLENEEVRKFEETHGRPPSLDEQAKISKRAERKVFGTIHEEEDDRARTLFRKFHQLWGIQRPLLIPEDVDAVPLDEEETIGMAAVVLPSYADELRYTPKRLKEILADSFDKIFKESELSCQEQTSKLDARQRRSLLEKFMKADEQDADSGELCSLLTNGIEEYMQTRTQFLGEFSLDLFRGALRDLDPYHRELAILRRFLEQRHLNTWLTILIDTSKSKKEILRHVSGIVEITHQIYGAEGIDIPASRSHKRKFNRYLQIWDMRAKRLSYEQIARRLYPIEYRNQSLRQRAINRTKKQFGAAYRLIYGEEYRPVIRRDVKKEDLPRTCEKCPRYKDQSCKELCPIMDAYVKQGQRNTLREKLLDDIQGFAQLHEDSYESEY